MSVYGSGCRLPNQVPVYEVVDTVLHQNDSCNIQENHPHLATAIQLTTSEEKQPSYVPLCLEFSTPIRCNQQGGYGSQANTDTYQSLIPPHTTINSDLSDHEYQSLTEQVPSKQFDLPPGPAPKHNAMETTPQRNILKNRKENVYDKY